MPSFNLDAWWDKNVDPNMSVLDNMYKEITREAIQEVMKLQGLEINFEEENKKEDEIDLDDIDLSAVLK